MFASPKWELKLATLPYFMNKLVFRLAEDLIIFAYFSTIVYHLKGFYDVLASQRGCWVILIR